MDKNVLMEMTKGYNPVERNQQLRGITDKWSRTGLLKKLNEDKSNIVAQLLENQAVELRNNLLNEETQTGGIAGYNKIAFPLVRRVFGQLLATELVAVQPMSLPSGLLFFLDFKYDRTNGGATTGGSVYGDLESRGNQQLDGAGAQTAAGGFYNFAGVGYSRRNFLLTAAAPVYSGVTTTSELLGGVTVSGYNFTLISSDATDLSTLNQMRMASSAESTASEATAEDGTFRTLRPIRELGGTTLFSSVDPTLTVLTGGTIQIFSTLHGAIAAGNPIAGPDVGWVDGAALAPVLVGPAKTSVSVDNGTNNLGDFESTSAIPEINIAVSSVPVQAVTRKLKATWTPELAQDINAYHAIDAEVELTTILSDIISTEIDREILSSLLSGAAVRAAWSRFPGRYVTWGTSDVIGDVTVPSPASSTNMGFTGTNQDWYQTLAETLLTVSNEIHKRNMRSGANWMVTSPDVATIIEAIAYFKPNATFDPTEVQYSMGIEKVGTLSNRFTVYKDPYFPVNKILMGYKGPGFLDAGYVYAPYVPLVFTPTIFEPNDFTPRKGAMTRYAAQMVRPDFYGTISVQDLNVIGGR
tara:strand:+ start:599 stop:2344 length:1746 start_codon:yes stop_codon:yes gene_type:complete